MFNALLLLLVMSSLVGGTVWQQPDTLHFETCDQRVAFDYPADFIVEEEPTNFSVSTPERSFTMLTSTILLQNTASGEEFDQFHQSAQVRISLDNVSPFMEGVEIDVEESMRSLTEGVGFTDVQDIELYDYTGLIAYTRARDRLLLQLDMGDQYVLQLWATADDNVPLSALEETVDLLVQTLEFESEYSVGNDKFFYFTEDCAFSLFYPDSWGVSEYRGRILVHDSEDTYFDFVRQQRVGDGNALIEIMPYDRILSYFDLAEDELTLDIVLESYMTGKLLSPLQTPELIDDDPDRLILTAAHSGGIVSVLETENTLMIAAFYGDSEDDVDEYWAVIDSIRLNGRAEELADDLDTD